MNLVGEFLILAERVLHDSQSDLISPINCLEVLAASSFPSHHPNFALFARYRLNGDPPKTPVDVTFRLIRSSETDGEEEVTSFPGAWNAGAPRARIISQFQMLRLHRAERLTFRLDHRVADGPWVPGPTCAIDIIEVSSTEPSTPPDP